MAISQSLIVFLLCSSLAFCAHVNHKQTFSIVKVVEHEAGSVNITGGYNLVPLDQANKNIDFYIKNLIPDLASSPLIQVQNQIVNGVNYIYTYNYGNNKTYSVYVYDQPADRSRQIRGISRSTVGINAQGLPIKTTTTSKISDLSVKDTAGSF